MFGGRYSIINKIEYINLNPDDLSYTVSQYQSLLPDRLWGLITVTLSTGIVYVIGGNTGTAGSPSMVNTIYVYNINTDFLYLSNIRLNVSRTEFAAVLDKNSRLWIFGGNSDNLTVPLNSIEYSNAPIDIHNTYNPTINPTQHPTINPSLNPSTNPSTNPTANPTNNPTLNPTEHPSKYPSNNPSFFPTDNPSSIPSKYPSLFPSINPSLTPTVTPTLKPTNYPLEINETHFPTKFPTNLPSNYPTQYPSTSPSNFPTITPTQNPTKTPSTPPTNYPTFSPSFTPSKSPSKSPSKFPTLYPTPYVNDKLISMTNNTLLSYPRITQGQGCDLDRVYEHKIWCFGGKKSDESKTVYSFNGNSFTYETPMTQTVYNTGNNVVIIDDIAYIFDASTYYILTYNILTKSFDNTFAQYPLEMDHLHVTVDRDNKIIYVGCSSNYISVYSFDINTNTWSSITDTNVYHDRGGIAHFNDTLVLFGGKDITSQKIEYISLNPLESYFSISEWQHILPDGLFGFYTASLGNRYVYLIGGKDINNQFYNKIWLYDIYNNYGYLTDVLLPTTIVRTGCSFDTNGKLWCFGGSFSGQTGSERIVIESNTAETPQLTDQRGI